MKIAIIGGVAAGTSAAAKARRENKEAEITIFEKGEDISYAGCGLPYYISDLIQNKRKVIINTPREFAEKYNVNVKINHEVNKIISERKIIKYTDLQTNNNGEFAYDKLIISTGAEPIFPPIPGSKLENVKVLRTVNDAYIIKNKIKDSKIGRAVIVGGGLIGLEMAESFSELGLEITVVEKAPQVLPPFSKKMADIVKEHLNNKSVDVIVKDGIKELQGNKKVEQVVTESGKKIKTDFVLISIGVKPAVRLAIDAGIELGETGAIKVNEKMETSIKDIYAAGDCCESKNIINNKNVWVPLGSTANKQGRTAGGNAAGGSYKHEGILQTGITKIFDLTVARTGLSEKEAREEGYEVETVFIKNNNHAHYYPGKAELNINGIFEKNSGRILGAEVIGGQGADKRIDILGTAIYSGLTAEDLFQLDLAYAPPFSTPKDPVAILGMVMEK